MVDLYIYSPDFALLGIVDTASSIIWTNRFRECGEFELYVPASAAINELLQEDHLVTLASGSDMVGIIEAVEIQTDDENGDYITVTGRDLRSILARRIVWEQTILTGNLEAALRQLVMDAFISPAIPERRYDKLALAEAHGYTETVETQYTGAELLEAIMEICAAYGYGFKMTMTPENPVQTGGIVLDFYKGADRSADQSENPRVIFSEDHGNLVASKYTRNKTEYKSVALVAGEGEGTARRTATVARSTDQSGLHRRELFVDARDVSSNEGEVADTEYLAQLSDRGTASLAEAALVESMEGTIQPDKMYTYGQDYSLGDTVTAINKYGIQASGTLLEVVEVWDDTGYTFTPTLG